MTALSCDRVRDLLPEWTAGRRQNAESVALESHLERCADCRAEAALLTALRHARPAVPVGLEERVLTATRRRPPARAWGANPRQLAIAATVVGAVIGGSLLLEVIGGRDGDRKGPASAVTTAGEAGALLPVLDDPVLHPGSMLSNLTEAELESLLARMES